MSVEASIQPRDRLSFTLFLAASLHAALILGVTFVWSIEPARAPTIEVTLAKHTDPTAPEDADFLAQNDQQGSGTLDESRDLTTTDPADFADNVHRELAAAPVPVPEPVPATEVASVTTDAARPEQAPTQSPTPDDPAMPSDLPPRLDLSADIASIQARLDDELNLDAEGPRVRRLTSVSARRSVDAWYLEAWRRKVERVGNLNYPEEARSRGLYGSLRLLVAITPDGGLEDVRVLDSSGYKVLDDAAVRIVRLAAPYAPFPPELRKDTDVLEIVRTWEFRKNRYSSS